MNAMNEQRKRRLERGDNLRLVLGGLLGALVIPACANHVSVPAEIATCPCANGAFCCSSGVCAADATGCDAATAALSNSVEGQWQGYFENFTLSTDDSLAISIVVADDGTMSGHVTIGQALPPAPPSDPDAVWPPGLIIDGLRDTLPPYIPGFAYLARNIRWEAQRLRFEIAPYEAWQAWCALQTTYLASADDALTAPGSYACIQSGPASQMTEGQCYANVDTGNQPCFKVFHFGASPDQTPVCACDSTGCQAATTNAYSFDIALRDGIGDGSTSLTGGNIRLNQTSAP